MFLLYLDSNWEKDYICSYLLKNIQFDNYLVISHYQLNDKLIDFLVSQKDTKFVFVFSSNQISYKIAKHICDIIKPVIVIHNSDEFGTRRNILDLAANTKLFLTQYRYYHDEYLRSNHMTNVLHLPLGFNTGFHSRDMKFLQHIKPSRERSIQWSFVGNLKSDRKEAIDTFLQKWPDVTYKCCKADKRKMNEIYSESCFVLSPRGNVSLLCFRTFEAITCGAIPVIVSRDVHEISNTYRFDGVSSTELPFVTASSWDEAVQKCKHMTNIDQVQQKCMEWWTSINAHITKTIDMYITQHQ